MSDSLKIPKSPRFNFLLFRETAIIKNSMGFKKRDETWKKK